MTKISEVRIAELFRLTHCVLGEFPEKIKSFFPEAEATNIFPNTNSTKGQVLEIRLNTLTFSCLLSEQSICEASFLFLDKTETFDEIIQFIEY